MATQIAAIFLGFYLIHRTVDKLGAVFRISARR